MQTKILKIQGMNNEGCADTVTRALEALDGVGSVSVSLAGQRATVQLDETLATPAQLQQALDRAGYRLELPETGGCCGGCCGS
ncbi:heavy-metal-associated domain-containing protein [Janthinobacterium fluminis]|uniref:Heavy-metal-associated domain-containing protein n=1 Tax=Janthinobacterium fluminis TaxID=2987524 RepID=A0ABT5JWA9_9BURK|nr:heavy-metal-associated domain-containing protein [Janthinobacterium fluminis]MDC8757025.1 heavy-metal-associated domain-containing protein [Janthinobacterium fluminis]